MDVAHVVPVSALKREPLSFSELSKLTSNCGILIGWQRTSRGATEDKRLSLKPKARKNWNSKQRLLDAKAGRAEVVLSPPDKTTRLMWQPGDKLVFVSGPGSPLSAVSRSIGGEMVNLEV